MLFDCVRACSFACLFAYLRVCLPVCLIPCLFACFLVCVLPPFIFFSATVRGRRISMLILSDNVFLRCFCVFVVRVCCVSRTCLEMWLELAGTILDRLQT